MDIRFLRPVVRSKLFCKRHIRGFTIGTALFAALGAAVYCLPLLMQAGAVPLDPDAVKFTPSSKAYSFVFLDTAGRNLGHRGPPGGDQLSLSDMPSYLPAAFLAKEDRRFYAHHGLDFIGLMRAAFADLRARKVVAGGSSISQQTAKLLMDRRQRTFDRKFRELVLTEQLEKSLTKAQILDIYLNRIYLGDNAYGVDMAARTYFGESARNVSLAQAAMLAALTRSPTKLSPRHNLGAAQARAIYVLNVMEEEGAISPAQAEYAKTHPAVIKPPVGQARSYFLDVAADEAQRVAEESNIPSGQLVVRTTLNSTLQAQAEEAVEAGVRERGTKGHFTQGAALVMSPQGAIAAMVGGVNYSDSEFNRVTQAHRQPGSSFKPFVYLAALENGATPWDKRTDGPVDIDGYQPANYKNESYGELRLTDALARSVNTVAVNLAQEVTLGRVISAAHEAGIKSELHPNPSLPLGTDVVTPLELTAAYASFAVGSPAQPFTVSSIMSADGRMILYSHEAQQPPPALSDSERRDMTAMLSNVVTTGTGTAARIPGRDVAGKTGTSQDYRDAWFIGYTPDWVAGVWVGNDDNSPMKNITGGSVPATVWRQIVTDAETGLPVSHLDKSTAPPDSVTADQPGAAVEALSITSPDPGSSEGGGSQQQQTESVSVIPLQSGADVTGEPIPGVDLQSAQEGRIPR